MSAGLLPTPDPVLNVIICMIALVGLSGVAVLVSELIKWMKGER